MGNADRLSGLDSSFLHLEGDSAHMHVAACAVLEGPAPPYEELLEVIAARLHLIPRYRQRLAFVPWGQGRPVWVDDPHFNLEFHVRHSALPRPGGPRELRRLTGRVFSQPLDRDRPLWELWLVEGLAEGRFAVLSKTHHSLVDGIAGVDIASVLFDASPEPEPVEAPEQEWIPRPLPTRAQLLGAALLERVTDPEEVVRGLRHAVRGPQRLAGRLGALTGLGGSTRGGLPLAPPSPFNVRIGPHRRFTWLGVELAQAKAVKDALGGTVNDVVLAAVAGGLGRYLRLHGHIVDGLELRAMVPVSVRADAAHGVWGHRVAATWAPLPVGEPNPLARLRRISIATAEVKESDQAIGPDVLAGLPGFAAPTIMAQAARLQARQALFNLVVTDVPGPQAPLYLMGRRLEAFHPLMPLAERTALGVAIMSYRGRLDFGLVADRDALTDVEVLAEEVGAAMGELVQAAGGRRGRRSRSARPRPARARG